MDKTIETFEPELTVVGVDIGKDVFHVVGFDAQGKIVLRRNIKRLALVGTLPRMADMIVGRATTS